MKNCIKYYFIGPPEEDASSNAALTRAVTIFFRASLDIQNLSIRKRGKIRPQNAPGTLTFPQRKAYYYQIEFNRISEHRRKEPARRMDEHQSIGRLLQGDMRGLEELVDAYYLQAVRVAFLIVQDRALAEDVAQNCLIYLQDKIHSFDPQREFRPWFLRIVTNRAITACRRRKPQVPLDEEFVHRETTGAAQPLGPAGANPEAGLVSAQEREEVWRALQRLNPQQRAAVVLHYFLDMSEAQTARSLGRPVSTVKWLLFSARRKLKIALAPPKDETGSPDTTKQKEIP